MNFSQALEILKAGYRIRRPGWKVTGLWLKIEFFDDPDEEELGATKILLIYYSQHNEGTRIKTVWTIPQADILADDWEAGP